MAAQAAQAAHPALPPRPTRPTLATSPALAASPPTGPYTVDDSPATVARIEADLADAIGTVRQADPHLRSLVLTGGFARGEGTVLDGVPQNDYDFVAVRGVGRPNRPYAEVQMELEARLGLHIDLAPVPSWRIPFVARSVFWYETALHGRVLWGEDPRPRIPVRQAADLDPTEGLRLLVNRAAGLLLVTASRDAHEHRIQAAKAILAALDAHLLAAGAFAPSQLERWDALLDLRDRQAEPRALQAMRPWLSWAIRFKTDPARAPVRPPRDAWAAARKAILEAVPTALAHAGLRNLDAYGRRDGWADRAVYWRRSARLPEARRLALHPTGLVRVATLRLLAATPDGKVDPAAAQAALGAVARRGNGGGDPLQLLDGLRRATLQ